MFFSGLVIVVERSLLAIFDEILNWWVSVVEEEGGWDLHCIRYRIFCSIIHFHYRRNNICPDEFRVFLVVWFMSLPILTISSLLVFMVQCLLLAIDIMRFQNGGTRSFGASIYTLIDPAKGIIMDEYKTGWQIIFKEESNEGFHSRKALRDLGKGDTIWSLGINRGMWWPSKLTRHMCLNYASQYSPPTLYRNRAHIDISLPYTRMFS